MGVDHDGAPALSEPILCGFRGRDPRSIRIDVVAPNRSRKLFEGFEAVGVERAILHLPFGNIDEVRRRLDEYASDFLPYFPTR